MSTPSVDYHMHTPLCGHAVGTPHEYAKHALDVGLSEIGFSDHAPLVAYPDPKVAMSFEQLPVYLKMIEQVREDFKNQLTIKIALEADYIEGYEDKTKAILNAYPYDYIIGSVHFIGDWGFDNPADVSRWNQEDVNAVYRQYYRLLRLSAQSRLFDIMGHVDLVKKFGHRPSDNLTNDIKHTAEVFKACSVAVEINTAGLRKPVKEMYPSLDALKIYCQAGVPLTFGSDSHDPQDVGKDFDKAVQLAFAAGYREYLVFSQRQIERKIKL